MRKEKAGAGRTPGLHRACRISSLALVQSQLVECGQEGVVCSHALLGGDRVWLAQSLSPAG